MREFRFSSQKLIFQRAPAVGCRGVSQFQRYNCYVFCICLYLRILYLPIFMYSVSAHIYVFCICPYLRILYLPIFTYSVSAHIYVFCICPYLRILYLPIFTYSVSAHIYVFCICPYLSIHDDVINRMQ